VIPISVGGLGLMEGAISVTLGLFGVSQGAAFAAAAANRLVMWLGAAIGGLVYLGSRDGEGEEDEPLELPAQSTVQPERMAQAREQAARLLWLVESLPALQREAFLLHEEGGLSLEQIAEVTGAGRETVKSRLRYALDKLREGMKDYL